MSVGTGLLVTYIVSAINYVVKFFEYPNQPISVYAVTATATVIIAVAGVAILSLLIFQHRKKQDKRTRSSALAKHCEILLAEFQKYNSIVYQNRTLRRYLSDFPYWSKIRQHFQTGHDKIYRPLEKVLETDMTLDEIEKNEDENFVLYEDELKNLFDGYNLNTRTLDGACDECLKYHEKKISKQYQKILHPEND